MWKETIFMVIVSLIMVFFIDTAIPDGRFGFREMITRVYGSHNDDGEISPVEDLIKDRDYIDNLRNNDSITTKKNITKIYNPLDKQVKIIQDNNTILNFKLTSPYHNLVGSGTDVQVAEFYLENFSSIVNLFDSINFYDIKGDYKPKQKDYWFKYGIDYIVEECHNLSEFDLGLKEDGTFCQNVTQTNWTRFDSLNDVSSKKIGLFTNTKLDIENGMKKVEWIGSIKGFDVLEWADYDIVGLSTFTDSIGDYSINAIYALAVTSDGNYLITSSYDDDYVSIMNITNKTSIVAVSTFNDSAGDYSIDGIRDLAITSDDNYLITSSRLDSYVSVMNITDKTSIVAVSAFNDSAGDYSIDGILALTVTSDDNYLITSSYWDDVVSVMNITDKTSIVAVSTFTDSLGAYSINGIYALAVTSDDNYLITSSFLDDYVSVMNITDKTSIVAVSTFNDSAGDYSIDGMYALTVTSDGNYLITSSLWDDVVSIMNITDKTSITSVSTYTDSAGDYSLDGIRALAVTSDGNYLITSSYTDDAVSIMNITDKTSITSVSAFNDSAGDYSIDGILALTVTSDGNYLITSSELDDYVSVMDMNIPDITPPSFSNNRTNASTTTYNGTTVQINLTITDGTAVDFYTLSHNDTAGGTWANESFVSAGDTSPITMVWNYSITNFPTTGGTMGWRVWANDTVGNVNISDIYTFVVQPIITDSCSCPALNTNWNVVDHCQITATCNIGTGILNISTGGWLNISGTGVIVNSSKVYWIPSTATDIFRIRWQNGAKLRWGQK